MTMSAIVSNDKAQSFVLAGNATFTLVSKDTERRFTYKMTKSNNKPNLYFVKLLHGPDNNNDYKYVGCYYSDTNVFYIDKHYRDRAEYAWPASIRAINYFLRHLDNLSDRLVVYHEGKCARCGRKLTTPESIITGFGPECRRLNV
jgi:hypothetical protein